MSVSKKYQYAINLALSFIDEHLAEDLSLKKVAESANYSSFHFHRIFKEIIGETLKQYIKRRRVEKAAAVLIRNQNISISQLSNKFGFNGSSSFSRAFKQFYNVSPKEFRNQSQGTLSKICHEDRKNGQVESVFAPYVYTRKDQKISNMNDSVSIRNLSETHLASVSIIGVQNIPEAFQTLLQWAGSKGLLQNDDYKVLMVYHDSFKVTAPDKVRMSASLRLEKPVSPEGEIKSITLPPGKHIVGTFEIPPQLFGQYWEQLFLWMKENGYKKADSDPFEIYHNDFNRHPKKLCLVNFCIPIL